jgi:hypothetical protein
MPMGVQVAAMTKVPFRNRKKWSIIAFPPSNQGEEGMKPTIGRRLGAGFAGLCLLAFASVIANAQVDKKTVLRQAHDAYYSLRSRGLGSFQCNFSPNWNGVLQEERKTNPQGVDHRIGVLNHIQFTVQVERTGSAKITHNNFVPENPDDAKGFDDIYSGMQQAMSGFFETWTPFMIASPFPDVESNYALVDKGDQWLLSYKEGANTDIVTTMGKDLVFRELKVNTPQFSSTLRPHFTSSAQGFLLTAYEADYRGLSTNDVVHLEAGIGYQTVNGFQLPQKLTFSGTNSGKSFQMEITFAGCQATRQ